MELIERYLNEVGKHLIKKNRQDILAEIRSHLEDTLDERTGGNPTEEDVVALLKETGTPRKMAASYSPEGQYVIGPTLYPLFRMITGIVLAATLGAQLLAWVISLWTGNTINIAEMVGGLLTSVPTSVGSVVIVFMILQAAGVNPKMDEDWDPRTLPENEHSQEVSRGEAIFGIAGGSLLMALLVILPERIGIYSSTGGEFYANPVILQYLPWILASLAVGIGLNIYLLWNGRWNVASRAVELGSDVFSIVVLALLYKGHTTWLETHGSSGFFFDFSEMAGDITSNMQLFGMKAFCMAFGIALIVVVVLTISRLVKMIIRSVRASQDAKALGI